MWPCWDLDQKRLVATEDLLGGNVHTQVPLREIKLYGDLCRSRHYDSADKRVVQLLDHFNMAGLNGVGKFMGTTSHMLLWQEVCIPFEAMKINFWKT